MQSLKELLENFNADALERLDEIYVEDCYFRDPFNELHNRDQVYKLFRAMLKLKGMRFVVHETVEQPGKAFVTWDFFFQALGKEHGIHGGSLLHFAEDGRIKRHVDYWDAAEGIYEKIPGLGLVLRQIKKLF